MTAVKEELAPLTVQQPEGSPIELGYRYGAASQFKVADRFLRRKKNGAVPGHLTAIAASNASGMSIPNKEFIDIVRDMQEADDVLRTQPSAPVIYRLHSEYGVAVTPEAGTSGLRLVNTGSADRKYFDTVFDVAKSYTLRRGPDDYEEREKVTEDDQFRMFRPLSFLSSGESDDVDAFMNYRAAWMSYPNSAVVVGRQAVDAFLEARLKKDLLLLDDQEDILPYGVTNSWAMLASAALQRLGYDSPIGKPGDLAHRASLEGMADVVASGLGYNDSWRIRMSGNEGDRFLRRLSGVDIDPEADARVVGSRAADLLLPEGGDYSHSQKLRYGDRDSLEAYTTEMAGVFIKHLVSVN